MLNTHVSVYLPSFFFLSRSPRPSLTHPALLSYPASLTDLSSHFRSFLCETLFLHPFPATAHDVHVQTPPLWLPGATWIERDKWICEELKAEGAKARKEGPISKENCRILGTQAHLLQHSRLCNSGMNKIGKASTICTRHRA